MCCRNFQLYASFFFEIIVLASCVKINNLQVPKVIQHGRAAVLDCDFTVEETEEELVVKWFFNKNNKTLVYQWIPASKSRPQVLGVLKDRLNLGYAAGVDANSIHRALHIMDAAPDLSGEYTCSVSTLQSEDIRTKSMLVFVPEKNLRIRRFSSEEGILRLQCAAEDVFPQPEVILYSLKRGTVKTEIKAKKTGHLFNVSATTTLQELEEPEEFSCELKISEANYTVRRHTIVYPGYMGNKGPPIVGDIWIIISASILVLSGTTGRSCFGGSC